ncbi:amidohydrolase [Granulicella sp. S190]|uniref:amidohydrolase family protein n=1 Tax=Granulicella sp. S190 TaxID=1747226 RepID=UPI00131E5180|nr:amidohydrolase family protein [Granulicella sp. S190]
MNRRHFLEGGVLAACGALSPLASLSSHAQTSSEPPSFAKIIDAHIHLFDPTRPEGIPWPLPGDLIYKPALPAGYESLARPLGIVGAIAIEASPLPRDNDWLLRTAESSRFIVGVIGDLVPTENNFVAELARLRESPLFLGIRQGNLWNRNLTEDVRSPKFWVALRELAHAGLVFESANPDLPLLEALAIVVDRMPELTVVIDHLPHMRQPVAAEDQRRFAALLTSLGKAPRCFAKLSEIPDQIGGRPVLDLAPYRARLTQLWTAFGPERLIFGSDWPNSDHIAGLPKTVGQVKRYIMEKDADTRAKLFFETSKSAYKWRPRQVNQML